MSFTRLKVCTTLVVVAAVAAGCGSSKSSSSSGSATSSASASSTSTSASSTPSISSSSFSNDLSAMATLKPLASAGKGKVAAILPDTVTSTRYVEFDAPYITKALTLAGLSSSDIIVQNAQGSDTTQFTDAQSDITKGATVLLVDPLDSRRRSAHRGLRQEPRRRGHRLRPPDPGWPAPVLRQL